MSINTKQPPTMLENMAYWLNDSANAEIRSKTQIISPVPIINQPALRRDKVIFFKNVSCIRTIL